MPCFPDDRALIVVDGHCALCSRWAGFIRRHDRRRRLRVTVTQDALGRALYAHYGLDPDQTNLLVARGTAFTRSDAVLGVLEQMGWPWTAVAVMRVLPRRLRDRLYDRLARNRFRVFGRTESCLRAAPEDADRFLA